MKDADVIKGLRLNAEAMYALKSIAEGKMSGDRAMMVLNTLRLMLDAPFPPPTRWERIKDFFRRLM